METIEMDLMQAQIGELTTEVTSVSGRVKKLEDNGGGGGGGLQVIEILSTSDYDLYKIKDVTSVSDWNAYNVFKTEWVNDGLTVYYFLNAATQPQETSVEANQYYKLDSEGNVTIIPAGTYNIVVLYISSVIENNLSQEAIRVDTATGDILYVNL